MTGLVLYTSGTTGAARGMHPDNLHKRDPEALRRLQSEMLSRPPVLPRARALLTLPMHHGAGPFVASTTLAMGGMVVCLDPFEPEQALRLIEEHGVTSWQTVPTMLLRIRALSAETFAKYDLSSLRVVVVGAAAVPSSLKDWFTEAIGEILWETYGFSEGGMVTALSPEDQRRKPGSCGRPYAAVDVRIVDEDWTPLPAGAAGEIAVRSPAVVGRYLGEAALGRETLSGDGFIRTGDIGHLDEEGFLFITDRRKDMIVAGGVNIYPAEVEKVLLQHPQIVDAAVVGAPEEMFGEQPKAFVELRPGAHLTPEDVIAFCEGRLARYKHPRIVEIVETLPRNPLGKVLKFELREREWQGRERKV
jgi:long-chain acyl-CoA synthetase